MKAKVIETGEIVDVKLDLSKQCCYIESVSPFSNTYYVTLDGNKSFMGYELDFNFKDIDWEQRRYELAKTVMQGILSDENVIVYACSEADYGEGKNTVPKAVAQFAVACADALIKKLKGK